MPPGRTKKTTTKEVGLLLDNMNCCGCHQTDDIRCEIDWEREEAAGEEGAKKIGFSFSYGNGIQWCLQSFAGLSQSVGGGGGGWFLVLLKPNRCCRSIWPSTIIITPFFVVRYV